jgi:hypothetical protein
MRRPYWDYFRSIEDDVIATSRYVEFVRHNYDCYSVEFARLVVAIGSELDMAFKKLCNAISPSSKAENIQQYRSIVMPAFCSFRRSKRYIRNFNINLRPFASWTPIEAPLWWKHGFTQIKHQRDIYFHHATLKNVLYALAALQIVLFHLYSIQEKSKSGEFEPQDLPRLIIGSLEPIMTHDINFLG